jgi:hypothetical protein
VDDNIGSGMPVDQAAEIILKATYLKRHEVIVVSMGLWVITRLCYLSTIVNTIAGDVKYRSQIRVMNKAKQAQ